MPVEILNSVSLAWVRCRSPFVAGARHGKQASQWQNSEKGDNSPRETGTKAKRGEGRNQMGAGVDHSVGESSEHS